MTATRSRPARRTVVARRVLRLVAPAALAAVAASACVTGAPPPTYASGTYPVAVTVEARAVSGQVGDCTVTGTTAPAALPGAEVTVPITPVDITRPVINLSGLTVSVPAATVEAGTVEVTCPGTAPVTATVQLRVGATTATRAATIGYGNTATLTDPAVELADTALVVDGVTGELPLTGVTVDIPPFDVRFAAVL